MGVRDAITTYVTRQGLLARWRRQGPDVDAAYAAVQERLWARALEARESRNPQELPPPAAVPFVWPTLQWTVLRSWQDTPWLLAALMLPAALYLIHVLADWLVLLVREVLPIFGK